MVRPELSQKCIFLLSGQRRETEKRVENELAFSSLPSKRWTLEKSTSEPVQLHTVSIETTLCLAPLWKSPCLLRWPPILRVARKRESGSDPEFQLRVSTQKQKN